MAGSADAQRLLLQVDASVELARRQLRDLTGVIDRETGNWDKSLQKGERSIQRTGQALKNVGQFRGGMQQLSFQIGDVTQQMALGTKASVIFAQQSGQVIQALQLMNTGSSGFLKFLAGPWGAVLTTAGVVLATFAGSLFKSKDAVGQLVDKMRDQAAQAANNIKADEAWKKTVEGLTEAIRKRREEQEKSLTTDIQAEQASLDSAKREAAARRNQLNEAREQLRSAEADLAAKQKLANSATEPSERRGSIAALNTARQRVAQLRQEIKQAESDITAAEANVRGAQAAIGERAVQGRVDAVAAATNRYTIALGNLRKELRAGKIDQAKFEAELEKATRKRDADIKAAQDDSKTKSDADTVAFIRPVSGGSVSGSFNEQRTGRKHAGLDLAVPVGTQVNAAAAGTVITAGVLPGYGNVVIIDHGRGTTTRYAHLSKFLVGKGDTVGQGDAIALSGGAKGAPGSGNSGGPHVHYEVRRGGKAVNPAKGSFPVDPANAGRGSVESAATAAKRAADLIVDQADAFASAMQQLDAQLLSATAELVTSIDGQAEYAKKQVEADQRRYELAIQNDVNDRRISDAQGKLLIEKSKAVTAQRNANIEARKMIQKLEEQQRNLAQESDIRVEGLRYADEIAKTQDAHRAIQLEILNALYQQRDADLRLAKAKADAAGNAEEAARIQREIDELPTRQARDTERTMRGTMNPMEAWADGVPQTAAEINEAFMSISAQGLDGLTDALTGVIMGTKSLGDAFRELAASVVADIAKMIIKMLILRALQSVFGMSGGGGASAGVTSNALAIGNAMPLGVPGAATGGLFNIGGRGGVDNNLLSMNGRPVLRVSAGEQMAIIPSTARIPRAANFNSSTSDNRMTVHAPIHFHGQVREPRRAGLQAAGALKRELGRAAKRGG